MVNINTSRDGKSVVIDNVLFVVSNLFTDKFPYGKDGHVPSVIKNVASSQICSFNGRGKQGPLACETFGRLLNEHVDRDLACRWGRALTKEQQESVERGLGIAGEESGTVSQVGGKTGLIGAIATDVIAVAGQIQKEAAKVESCHVYLLGKDETIDSFYGGTTPPASTG